MKILSAGSVDDGKSTLLGRLVHDLGAMPADVVDRLRTESRAGGGGELDYSLVFDGLIDEKAQGITIDIAWRYLWVEGEPLVLADCPGHVQYTRNMVSAASQCSAGILLVDASRGLTEQTWRHLYLCSLLRLGHLFIAVNKIDLIDQPEAAFRRIEHEIQSRIETLPHGFDSVTFAPTSGTQGINVIAASTLTPWYSGLSLYQWIQLRMREVDADPGSPAALIFPIQRANRPSARWRSYDGTVAAGVARAGQAVQVLPGQRVTRIESIHTMDAELPSAAEGRAVSLVLADEMDLSRGDVLVSGGPLGLLVASDFVEALLVWIGEEPAVLSTRYLLRLGCATTPATLTKVLANVDWASLCEAPGGGVSTNAVSRVEILMDRPVALTRYAAHRELGGFMLVDPVSNETVAAGVVTHPEPRKLFWHEATVTPSLRMARLRQRPVTVWLTGLSGAGKSTLANAVEAALQALGHATYLLDGDNLRHGLCRDLGFSEADRAENVRRAGEVARLMTDAGLIVLACFISPSRRERQAVRDRFKTSEFREVHVNTPLTVCEQRDPKGLYRLARTGALENFTGISAPYEVPIEADLVIDTSRQSLDDSVRQILAMIAGLQ
ncbi:MAG: adenylyl-sulfate kinase [Ramlibacter sp.]|nr:adenylyl-sulfate kinase [Ramlibacter sp.]